MTDTLMAIPLLMRNNNSYTAGEPLTRERAVFFRFWQLPDP